jgi:hypothetical protein
MSTTKWEPFQLARRFEETVTPQYQQPRNKKHKKSGNGNQQKAISYADAASTMRFNPYNTPSGATTRPQNNQQPTQETNIRSEQADAAISQLQKELESLKTVTEKIQSDNRSMTTSINEVKQTTQKSIENLKVSMNEQHNGAVNQMKVNYAESEQRINDRIDLNSTNLNNTISFQLAAIMNSHQETNRNMQEEKAAREAASEAEKRERDSYERQKLEHDRLREEHWEMRFGHLNAQPHADVMRNSPTKTPRSTLDMTGATAGHASKKSKTLADRSLSERSAANLNRADHPMKENFNVSRNQHEGYAAGES